MAAGVIIKTEISIHAPTRGATPFGMWCSKSNSGFQSTLPREERPRGLC